MRTFSKELVDYAITSYRDRMHGFELSWLDNEKNIALSDEKGNVSLFEFNQDGLYTGHYFYHCRGKDAFDLAKSQLNEMFSNYDVRIIRGLTPVDNLGARWMSKKIGFTSYGIEDTFAGPCELFILTRQEWENANG